MDNTATSTESAIIGTETALKPCQCKQGGQDSGRKFRLTSYENTKKSYTRIIKLYDSGKIDAERFRNMIYALSKYLEFLKFEKNADIEKRLLDLEEKLQC